ncbi:MAG: VIT1/CCC1 transporter family protein [Candidatus Micrarchaeota archaeon]|nr:VIT1/CCC1 transporter family protein [Candidatus Micrarchaeota archaeon]
MTAYKVRHEHTEDHAHPTFLSDFILGSQDGLVNVLGILLGVAAATSDIRILFVAGLAALGAESISMGAVAYTSTLSRRRLYLKEVDQEMREMREIPKVERKEVEDVLVEWGYKGSDLRKMLGLICSNPKAWLEFMMAFELKLSPVPESAPLRSFLTVLFATIVGSVIPLVPFAFFGNNMPEGMIASVIISGATLFMIGYYEAKVTKGSIWASGLRMMVIGLVAGFAGYLIGHFIGATPV